MRNETNAVENVTDVIQVMNAGIEFYQEATSKVDNESVKTTFRKMMHDKKHLVENLQPLAKTEQGEIESDKDTFTQVRQQYTKILSAFSSDNDLTFVKQLEEVEDKILESLDSAIDDTESNAAVAQLREVRVKAQQMHDEMKRLQETLKH